MTLGYDGTRYYGWEHQPNTDMTIQGKLETVLTRMTGLPEDIENPLATVQTQVGRGETPTVIAENAEVKDGVITAAEAAENTRSSPI